MSLLCLCSLPSTSIWLSAWALLASFALVVAAMAAGLQSIWPRVPVRCRTPCGRPYSRSAPMLTTAIMVHSCPSGSSMSRRSRRCTRVAEKPLSWAFVKSVQWRKMKSSGVGESGAKHHACAVCDHNGRMDLQAISNG